MKPVELYKRLGADHIDAYYGELSGKEIRSVLKAGETHTAVPKTAYTQSARRGVWRRRIDAEVVKEGNEKLALAILLEWLMAHHREMLITFLDFLEVKHTRGETDEDFCETKDPDQLRAGVDALLAKYPPHHVATYVLLLGHLQNTTVFDQTEAVLGGLGLSASEAAAYVEAHRAAHGDGQKAAS
ncbi:MAG: hypothetical protein R3A51_00965 [Nannocystaceae bacterium]